jgi:fatty-acyl-CoA synthase
VAFSHAPRTGLADSGAHTLIVEEGHRALVESVLDDIPARTPVLVDT